MINYSLAGLADIVLLLLVFFLLTSSFIPQFGIEVTLPKTESAAPTKDSYVTVIVTKEGSFYVEQQQVSKDQLTEAIRRVMGDKTGLVLRADEEAQIKHLATVGSIAQALNLKVKLATERADPSQRF